MSATFVSHSAPRRGPIRLLAGLQIALAATQLCEALVPPTIHYLPLISAIQCVHLAQVLLLAFWLAFGTDPPRNRVLGVVLGVGCLTGFSEIGHYLTVLANRLTPPDYAWRLLIEFVAALAVIGLIGGVLLAVRRWVAHLDCRKSWDDRLATRDTQFSVLQLLLMTTIAALVLALARGTRASTGSFAWNDLLAQILGFVVFFLNTICGMWASLAEGRTWWRIALVLLISIFLGFVLMMAFGSGPPADFPIVLPWWLKWTMLLVTVVPTTIIITSLLLVRQSGYRLVFKTRAARVETGGDAP